MPHHPGNRAHRDHISCDAAILVVHHMGHNIDLTTTSPVAAPASQLVSPHSSPPPTAPETNVFRGSPALLLVQGRHGCVAVVLTQWRSRVAFLANARIRRSTVHSKSCWQTVRSCWCGRVLPSNFVPDPSFQRNKRSFGIPAARQ